MRRLLTVILALACGLFAQVQPVGALEGSHRSCCCGDLDGSCGMPDCLPPPAASTVLTTLDRPAPAAAVAVRRAAPCARAPGEKFFASFMAPAADSAAARGAARMTPPASVPRFTAHCSWLL